MRRPRLVGPALHGAVRLSNWRDFSGWRGLRRFWIAIGSLLLVAAMVLQILGPPQALRAPPQLAATHAPAGGQAETKHAKASGHLEQAAANRPPLKPVSMIRPGRVTTGPVADPDPALLIAMAADSEGKLPRIAADGRAPMALYAAGFDVAVSRPRVGLLIAGIGMNVTDSMAAITQLPGAVTLAITPYAGPAPAILAAARQAQHEYLLSLPMQPDTFPIDDPDDRHALLPSLSPADNYARLRWLLSQLPGYVGVTSIFGMMRGERLLGMPDQVESLLHDIADRGLLFISGPAVQSLPYAWTRSADMLIDDGEPDAAMLDDRLNQLTDMARDKGSALGIVSLPHPVSLERVAAWCNGLAAKGVVLAPVSALVQPPTQQEAAR